MTAVMEKSHWYINAEIESVRLTLEIEVQDWIYDGDRILPHSWTDVIQSMYISIYPPTLSIYVLILHFPPPLLALYRCTSSLVCA